MHLQFIWTFFMLYDYSASFEHLSYILLAFHILNLASPMWKSEIHSQPPLQLGLTQALSIRCITAKRYHQGMNDIHVLVGWGKGSEGACLSQWNSYKDRKFFYMHLHKLFSWLHCRANYLQSRWLIRIRIDISCFRVYRLSITAYLALHFKVGSSLLPLFPHSPRPRTSHRGWQEHLLRSQARAPLLASPLLRVHWLICHMATPNISGAMVPCLIEGPTKSHGKGVDTYF